MAACGIKRLTKSFLQMIMHSASAYQARACNRGLGMQYLDNCGRKQTLRSGCFILGKGDIHQIITQNTFLKKTHNRLGRG